MSLIYIELIFMKLFLVNEWKKIYSILMKKIVGLLGDLF